MTKNAIIIGAGASGAVAVGAFAIAKIFGNKQNSGKPFGREDLVAVPVQKNTSFGSGTGANRLAQAY
ncbi:MAG: hypothetical protein NTV88_04315 [Candidatus Micrarchaeota archaeon]|nr:hypothetical protein [Candidatus Micrarchaeota archaeon]